MLEMRELILNSFINTNNCRHKIKKMLEYTKLVVHAWHRLILIQTLILLCIEC